ncbi:hypothetical protein MM300_16560 [Evansella sp. LMS18]|uniref:hypothetical protein n=1 Tax=Evansella sp. LMS18 TaxID=2924033 RepID=UPI0020D12CA1|nr:hypothetical protein [Evansella sp. LMS18]UTR09494.1 hypothetical protein MM300_16560 [Evansella sp. LMS18]
MKATNTVRNLHILMLAVLLFTAPVSALAHDGHDTGGENGGGYTEDIMHRHSAIKPHFYYYMELLFEKFQPELKGKWQEVVREKEAIYKKMKELSKEGETGDHPAESEAWEAAHKSTQEKFLQAVKKRDEESLKALLPELLSLHRKWNEEHRNYITGN